MSENINLEAEKMHRDCEPHDAEHCDINEHHNNAKNGFDAEADDCGHTVQSGPKGGGHPVDGTVTAGFTPTSAKGNKDKDQKHGPDVK